MTINLTAIRRLRVPSSEDATKNDTEKTIKLRRYILGLSLIAATAPNEDKYSLREGCQLRLKDEFKPVWQEIHYEEANKPLLDLATSAFDYAKLAAESFGIGGPYDTDFDPKTAEQWLELTDKDQKRRRLVAPMTKQDFEAKTVQTLTGTVLAILPESAGLKVKSAGKNKQEVEVKFSPTTEFKGKDGSTIMVDEVPINAKVVIKHEDGVANSVIIKK